MVVLIFYYRGETSNTLLGKGGCAPLDPPLKGAALGLFSLSGLRLHHIQCKIWALKCKYDYRMEHTLPHWDTTLYVCNVMRLEPGDRLAQVDIIAPAGI